MTLEEFKALVQKLLGDGLANVDESAWSQIESGLESVVTSNINGVIENRDKILSEKKTLADKYKELETQIKQFGDEGITLEAWTNLKQRAENAAKGTTEDVSELQKRYYEQGKRSMEQELQPKLKEAMELAEQKAKDIETLRKRHIDALTDIEISKALSELNVETDELWLTGLRHKASVEYIESEDAVQIDMPNPGDMSQRIPLKDWKKIFPGTTEGKRRIKVRSSGSGANGSDGKGSGPVSLKDTIQGLGFPGSK